MKKIFRVARKLLIRIVLRITSAIVFNTTFWGRFINNQKWALAYYKARVFRGKGRYPFDYPFDVEYLEGFCDKFSHMDSHLRGVIYEARKKFTNHFQERIDQLSYLHKGDMNDFQCATKLFQRITMIDSAYNEICRVEKFLFFGEHWEKKRELEEKIKDSILNFGRSILNIYKKSFTPEERHTIKAILASFGFSDLDMHLEDSFNLRKIV